MLQKAKSPRGESSINIIGAGIAGSWQALLFARAGYDVTLHERGDAEMTQATSHWAGGMLAPWCEREASEPVITRLGIRSLDLWREQLPETPFNGSLVVSHPRDRTDFERFAKLTTDHERLGASGIAELEPSLDGRFREALFFAGEGHVEPRAVLPKLHRQLAEAGAAIKFQSDCEPDKIAQEIKNGIVIDCRGLAARESGTRDLRGVKGEMVIIETPEVQLSRPVRLIHPRWPLYIVPRDGQPLHDRRHHHRSPPTTGVSVRSALELLTAPPMRSIRLSRKRASSRLGAGLRPAFPDNLPRIAH